MLVQQHKKLLGRGLMRRNA